MMGHVCPGFVKPVRHSIGIALFCWISILPGQQGDLSDKLDDEIKDLCRVVLSRPEDAPARQRLAELRRQQQQQRGEALDALVKGLNSYAGYQLRSAEQNLTKAMQSKYVRDLAGAVLGTGIEDILAQCDTHGRAPTQCRLCFGSHLASCRDCDGRGVLCCRSCQGKGEGPDRKRRTRYVSFGICEKCQGLGWIECPTCRGEGFVACERCAARDGGTAANTRQAIDRLIAIANYLRNGGIDLVTPDALKCSPRVEPADGQSTSE
jgi:hypothetical protein